MDDNIIDTAETLEPAIVETEAVVEQAETPEETEAQEEKRLTEAEWLKKERNVVSRRDKQIGKLRAQYEAAQAELSKFQQQQQQAQPPKATERPKATDFTNYHEFLVADQRYERAQELKAFEERLGAKETASVSTYREQQFIAASDNALQAATLEYAKTVPNIEQMIEQHGQTISSLPDGIKRVIRELDPQDVVKAFHAFVENDTLEDLADMSPAQAAAAIAKAASTPRQAPVTRAPAPMASAKGTSQGSKTLNRMSPEELVQWVNS